MSRTIRVATDVGGTFTDLVCFETDHATGESRVITAKSDTTPPNFETGVLNVLAKRGVDPSSVDFLAHGTTVIHAGNRVEVDGYGNIHIHLS